MGTLLTAPLRLLAMFERTRAFLRSTLTKPVCCADAWLRSAAVNGRTSQNLDKAFMVSSCRGVRYYSLRRPPPPFSRGIAEDSIVKTKRDRSPAAGDNRPSATLPLCSMRLTNFCHYPAQLGPICGSPG